jgi:hypothetical protein
MLWKKGTERELERETDKRDFSRKVRENEKGTKREKLCQIHDRC